MYWWSLNFLENQRTLFGKILPCKYYDNKPIYCRTSKELFFFLYHHSSHLHAFCFLTWIKKITFVCQQSSTWRSIYPKGLFSKGTSWLLNIRGTGIFFFVKKMHSFHLNSNGGAFADLLLCTCGKKFELQVGSGRWRRGQLSFLKLWHRKQWPVLRNKINKTISEQYPHIYALVWTIKALGLKKPLQMFWLLLLNCFLIHVQT